MTNRDVVNGLALTGALLVLLGVTFAANSALADETAAVSTTAVAIHMTASDSREQAVSANEEAATNAAQGLALDNRLNLEFRLSDHSSAIVVRAR